MSNHTRTRTFYKRRLLIAERECAFAYDPKLGKVFDKLLARRHKISMSRAGKIRRSLGVPMYKGNE